MRRPPGAPRGERRAGRALPLRHHADADLSAPPGTRPDRATSLHLRLRDFRNFAALDFRAPAERLLLVGPNGAGKTSLLEAIYLAATSRSFRAARLEACARRGGEGFDVALAIGERPRRELSAGWSPANGKRRALDGKSVPLAEQLAVLPLLVWTAAEAELVAGGPAVRRRFFDRGLAHARPGMLESLGRYARALAEKRALLAAGEARERELAAWNDLLARHGAEIARGRDELVARVDEGLQRLAGEHAPALPPLGLRYRPSTAAALDGEAALAAELAAAAGAERARRQALVGPHRDEIELLWDGAAARGAASAGERKALGLLVLAALAGRLADAGREPALLLDDADSELDRARLATLVPAFGRFSRLLVTSNRPEVWPPGSGLETVAVERLVRDPAAASQAAQD